MAVTILDTDTAMTRLLAAPPEARPDLVRDLWAPMAGMYSFLPAALDLLDAHRGSFGFPLEGSDAALAAALDRLRRADAWERIGRALADAAEHLAPFQTIPADVRVLLILGDPTDKHYREAIDGLSAFGGISGFIVLTLWPNDRVLSRLEAIAAHEFHHNVRYSPGGVVWNPATVTLGEQVIAEGLADAFARDLYGDLGPTHFADAARADPQVLTTVMAALGQRDMRTFTAWIHGDSSARRFGVRPAGLPNGAGYAAGLTLVDAYLRATGRTAAEGVHDSADEVLVVALPALGLADRA